MSRVAWLRLESRTDWDRSLLRILGRAISFSLGMIVVALGWFEELRVSLSKMKLR